MDQGMPKPVIATELWALIEPLPPAVKMRCGRYLAHLPVADRAALWHRACAEDRYASERSGKPVGLRPWRDPPLTVARLVANRSMEQTAWAAASTSCASPSIANTHTQLSTHCPFAPRGRIEKRAGTHRSYKTRVPALRPRRRERHTRQRKPIDFPNDVMRLL